MLKCGDVFRLATNMLVYTKETRTHGVSAPIGEYVVESGKMTGGGTGHGPHDVYPDGWFVSARKLAENGSYDPAGEIISFFQSGCFNVVHRNVETIREMKRAINFTVEGSDSLQFR